MAGKNTLEVTTDSFTREVLDAELPVIVDFWAPWCGPCRAIGPILEELAGEYRGRVKVTKVNVDEHPTLAQAFRVRGIPTLVALIDGEVAEEIVGFGGRPRLEHLFARLAKVEEDRAAS